jgi:hypothetical protein
VEVAEERSEPRTRFIVNLTKWADRLLPAWFLVWSAVRMYQLSWDGSIWQTDFLGRDFRIYRNAAVALVNGGDPWAAFSLWNNTDWHFAALPPAAQLFVPFTWLSEGPGLAIFVGLCVAASVVAFRRLGLPVWWLLFPPLMEGLVAANPQILLLGLLLAGGPVARSIAAGLKVYSIMPVIARREWAGLAAVAALFLVSFAAAPGLWSSYLGQFGTISSRIAEESQGGLSAALLLDPDVFGSMIKAEGVVRLLPGLLLFGLVCLILLVVALRDVRSAGWLAVPLLWPAAEYHYATFALPVARRISIWIIAIPLLPTYLLGLILLAYEVTAQRRAIVREPPAEGLAIWLRAFRTRRPEAGRIDADQPVAP